MPVTVFGLPTHVLVLHAVVVLVPLSAVGVVLIALVPRLRPMLRWPVLAVLLPAVVAVPVATESGEDLQRRLAESGQLGGQVAEKVALHQQLGELVIYPAVALTALAVALVVLDLRGARPLVVKAVAALAVLAAVASVVQVVRTGHAGATAVWNPGG